MPLRRLILLALAFPLCARLPATASVTPPAPPAPSGLALSIDAAAGRHAISPYIYGLNFATAGFAAEIGLPLRRWGGNAQALGFVPGYSTTALVGRIRR